MEEERTTEGAGDVGSGGRLGVLTGSRGSYAHASQVSPTHTRSPQCRAYALCYRKPRSSSIAGLWAPQKSVDTIDGRRPRFVAGPLSTPARPRRIRGLSADLPPFRNFLFRLEPPPLVKLSKPKS